MNKDKNNQFLINSVKSLDQINNLDIKFTGTIQEILNDPLLWAEKQAEKIIINSQGKYAESKKLGEDFYDGISNLS